MNSPDDLVSELSDDQIKQHLDQVASISQNARGTWFSLIVVLLFTAIAVAGVEDKDFFMFGAGLNLPVIGYTVPVESFFYAAPTIILGLFAYLHLYLLKLWRLLGELPPILPDGRELDNAVYPWIATDAVISLKSGITKRPFRWLTRLVVFVLVWTAAPGILLYIWWESVVPHDLLLTSWTGLLAGAAIIGGTMSLWACITAILPRIPCLKDIGHGMTALTIGSAVILLAVGELRSKGRFETEWVTLGFDDYLYSAQLYRTDLVERPKDWLSYDEAFEKYKVLYSGQKRIELQGLEKDKDWFKYAKSAFLLQRASQIKGLKRRKLRGIDLRKADLTQAFMVGIDLREADLSGANLTGATLEQVELNSARLNHTLLISAKLNGAQLIGAQMNGAVLSGARLTGARLTGAQLNDAKLFTARLIGAQLNNAELNHAVLAHARLDGAVLIGAQMNDAKLIGALMNNAKLNRAQLTGASLNRAVLTGANLNGAALNGAKLNHTWLNRTQLANADLANTSLQFAFARFIDLSRTRNVSQAQLNSLLAVGESSLPDGLYRPAHWEPSNLLHDEAYALWKKWRNLEHSRRSEANSRLSLRVQ